MARIWMSGLEAGHIDIFDSSNAATISAAQARTGTYSFLIGTLGSVNAAFPAPETEIFGRIGIRSTYGAVIGGFGNGLLRLYDNAGGSQIVILLSYYTNTIFVRRGAINGTVIGVGGILHQNRWQCMEFRLLVDNAAGVFQLKVDGTLVIDFAGDTQNTANADVLGFRIGWTEAVGPASAGYYDDIAFNNVGGGVNDSWIGRGGIPAIFPEGVGNSTDLGLFPNGGEANWEDVDEKPPDDDTTYVFDDVIDEHDSYETGDLPVTGTIAAVQWLARARSDLVGAPEIARILRIGGVDYQGADVGIDVAYDYRKEIFDEDPDAGPGAWTVAAINGMEIGVKVR